MDKRLLAIGTPVVALIGALPLLLEGTADDRWRGALLSTARTSSALYLLFFGGAGLATLWPNAATRWLGSRQSEIALLFCLSHGLHAGAIAGRGLAPGSEFFSTIGIGTWVGGGAGYLLVALLAWTTLPAGAPLLAAQGWRIARAVGDHVLWLFFLANAASKTVEDLAWLPWPVVISIALGLRLAARRRPMGVARSG